MIQIQDKKLVWDPMQGITHVKVYRRKDGEVYGESDMVLPAEPIPVINLVQGFPPLTVLYFSICAWDPGTGTGGVLSNEVQFIVPFAAIQNLRII